MSIVYKSKAIATRRERLIVPIKYISRRRVASKLKLTKGQSLPQNSI